jgi:hypothetical protein
MALEDPRANVPHAAEGGQGWTLSVCNEKGGQTGVPLHAEEHVSERHEYGAYSAVQTMSSGLVVCHSVPSCHALQ